MYYMTAVSGRNFWQAKSWTRQCVLVSRHENAVSPTSSRFLQPILNCQQRTPPVRLPPPNRGPSGRMCINPTVIRQEVLRPKHHQAG